MQVFAPGLTNLCQLCDTLHRNNDAVRTRILNTISFHTPAIVSLWHKLSSTIEFGTFVEKGISGNFIYGCLPLKYSSISNSLSG